LNSIICVTVFKLPSIVTGFWSCIRRVVKTSFLRTTRLTTIISSMIFMELYYK